MGCRPCPKLAANGRTGGGAFFFSHASTLTWLPRLEVCFLVMCKAWLGPFAGKLAFVSETSESRGRACFGSGDTIDLDEVEWNLTERVDISEAFLCINKRIH